MTNTTTKPKNISDIFFHITVLGKDSYMISYPQIPSIVAYASTIERVIEKGEDKLVQYYYGNIYSL